MMFACKDRVCLDELREQMEATGRSDGKMQMKEAEGIGGRNPLKYASAERGQKIVEFCAERIEKKTIDVLEGRIDPTEKADDSFMDNQGPTD